MSIECFDKINIPELKEKFNSSIKEGMSDSEQREIATKIALDYHKGLFDKMNDLKKQIYGKSFKPSDYNSQIKITQNATKIEEPGTLDVGDTSGNGKEVGNGNAGQGIPPGEGRPKEESQAEGEEKGRLAHADTEEIYKTLGLKDRIQRETKPDTKLEQDANDLITSGADLHSIANEVHSGKRRLTDTEQVAFAKAVNALKEKQEGLKIDDPEFDKYQNEIEHLSRASDTSGSETGAALRARQLYVPKDETLSDYVMREKEVSGVPELTENQKTTVQKEYEQITKTQSELEEKLKELSEENTRLKAENEVKKSKKETPTKSKKTSEAFKKEREDIFSDIKKHWDESKGQLSATVIPYADRLVKIAPDVAKLVKSYIEEGIDKLEDIVKGIHAQAKEFIPEITEKDIHNIIAGEYKEATATKNQLAEKLFNLQTQAKLINKLEALNNGEIPKSEKKKIERSKEIEDLKKQIKEHDLTKLSAVKTKLTSDIEATKKAIDEGRYAPDEKKKPIKLDEEATALKDRLIKLKQEREIRLIKQQYANRNKYEKTRDIVLEVANVPRTIMSSVDFSAPLRQGIIPTISHPIVAMKAGSEMFKAAFSQKRFDRWFFDYKESPLAKIADESKLSVTDPHDYRLSAKEEAFMNNMAEKIPLLGKLVKGSERAYVLYLNKMRVDLFKSGVDELLMQGKTIENSKEIYEALASWVNNSTGRGELGKLQSAAPILNSVFFAPRLIASRLNLLNPLYYAKLPKEIRVKAIGDMLKFIGFGMSVLALAKINGASVELDPRSTDFGKIKVGDTRYDIWGGFQQYIRVISQLASGQTKSTTTGKISSLTDKKKMAFGKDRGDVIGSFIRGKVAPVPSMAWDFIKGRTAVGQPVSPVQEAIDHFQPLLFNDIQDAWKTQGVKSLFTVGLPSTFGVGVQTYQAPPPKKSNVSNGNFAPNQFQNK